MDGKRMMATVMGVLGAALLAEAHLVAGSLAGAKGGETFAPGQVVQVKWRQDVGHDGKYDFKFSKDGGTTFTVVENNKQLPTAAGEITYQWTVPNEATTTGQFKICQQAGGAACTDATYMLKSANFTISGSNAVRGASSADGSSLRFDATTRNLEVSFVLEKDEKVGIQAFDAQGKLLAVLLEGSYKAGSHRLSVFSSGLDASGALLFQLRMGEQVRTFKD